MKLWLVIAGVLALLPGMALAATPVTAKVANTYYLTCMSRQDPRLDEEGQQNLCSCASARLMTFMTSEDIMHMTSALGPGRASYNKMLADVYAPCLETAIENTLVTQCMNDRTVKEFMLRDKDKLCACTGRKTGVFMEQKTSELVRQMIKETPNLTDIYDPLLNNPVLRHRAYNNLSVCLQELSK